LNNLLRSWGNVRLVDVSEEKVGILTFKGGMRGADTPTNDPNDNNQSHLQDQILRTELCQVVCLDLSRIEHQNSEYEIAICTYNRLMSASSVCNDLISNLSWYLEAAFVCLSFNNPLSC